MLITCLRTHQGLFLQPLLAIIIPTSPQAHGLFQHTWGRDLSCLWGCGTGRGALEKKGSPAPQLCFATALLAWGGPRQDPSESQEGGLEDCCGSPSSLSRILLQKTFSENLKLWVNTEWTTHFTQPGWIGRRGHLANGMETQESQSPGGMGRRPPGGLASRTDNLEKLTSGLVTPSLACQLRSCPCSQRFSQEVRWLCSLSSADSVTGRPLCAGSHVGHRDHRWIRPQALALGAPRLVKPV